MATKAVQKLEVQNFTSPNHVYCVDASKYQAMKKALLAILPKSSPGLTVAEGQQGVLAHLPETLFPGGAKAGWWFKCVQLDLEAKGVIVRTNSKPLRLHRA